MIELLPSLITGAAGAALVVIVPVLYRLIRTALRLRLKSFKHKTRGRKGIRYLNDRPVALCLDAEKEEPQWLPPSKFGVKTKEDAERWAKGS